MTIERSRRKSIENRKLVPEGHTCICDGCVFESRQLRAFEPIHICMNPVHGNTEDGFIDWDVAAEYQHSGVCRTQ